MFDDLDEQGEQLLGSLHLGPAEEEPVRRGAASRANSVRFDESALHGSSWGGQNNRHSGDFGPVRPGSSLMMERSLSHKSDGRHSSAGHSVHSHHSVASGRASSLGLDTNFATVDDDDDSSFEIPGPPVSFYVLGTVPSIVRCWLTTNYAHGTLLYADLCSGSQRSTIDFSLIKELDLQDEIQRDGDGAYRARLNVYFAEAVITQHRNRSNHDGSVPSMSVLFEVNGMENPEQALDRKAIRIFIGSDALRAHSADILLSQNNMVLYGNERERLRVPFVRPEDEAVFRHISTANIAPDRPKLNANAAPFILGDVTQGRHEVEDPEASSSSMQREGSGHSVPVSPAEAHQHKSLKPARRSSISDQGEEGDKSVKDGTESEAGGKGGSNASDVSRRESSAGIWGSWRQGASGPDGTRENGSLSGYQPAARGGRNMKVLKPQKSGSAASKGNTTYDPPLPPKSSSEARRKSQASSTGGDGSVNGSSRWDLKRAPSHGAEAKAQPSGRENRPDGSLPRSVNPVGVASAFSWMTPTGPKQKSSAGAE